MVCKKAPQVCVCVCVCVCVFVCVRRGSLLHMLHYYSTNMKQFSVGFDLYNSHSETQAMISLKITPILSLLITFPEL